MRPVALLLAFAFVAGAATALSPCVLPVLPVALAAGVTGGRRRPLGVVVGLAASFAFATVALVYVIDALGLPDALVRDVAIVVLLGFGTRCGAGAGGTARGGHRPGRPRRALRGGRRRVRVRARSSERASASSTRPCAGPILAGVITVSASQDFTAGRLAVALAYAVGSGVVLYVLMLGGARLTGRLAPRAGALQMATGAVMVARRRGDARRPRHSLPDARSPTTCRRSLVEPDEAARAAARVATSSPRSAARGAHATSRGARGRAGLEAAGARRRARLHRQPGVVQHAGRRAARLRGPPRQGRAGRLLDLHLHQLHPHAALPEGLGRALPRRRARDRRRPHARVPVRARRRQRARRDQPERHPLPGRAGQRLRHLERLRQPVLAGEVPDRREGPGALHALRRGRLREDRERDPRACSRRPGAAPGARARASGERRPRS